GVGAGHAPANSALTFDRGFDEILRTTDAGHDLERALATELVTSAPNPIPSLTGMMEAFSNEAGYRGGFLSVGASGAVKLAIHDAAGHVTSGCLGTPSSITTGLCPDPDTPPANAPDGIVRQVPGASLLGFDDDTLVGAWAIIGGDLRRAPDGPD